MRFVRKLGIELNDSLFRLLKLFIGLVMMREVWEKLFRCKYGLGLDFV